MQESSPQIVTMSVRKVFITGGPASGKTTLSQRIATAIKASVYELDGLLMSGHAHGDPFEVVSHKETSRIIAMNAWVAEGSYLGWTEPLLRCAEIVVWMEVPWPVASYRIISRHIWATIARNNRFPGWRRLYRFWRWSGRYYNNRNSPGLDSYGVPNTKATAVEYLAPYKDKLYRCRTQEDTEEVLAQVLD